MKRENRLRENTIVGTVMSNIGFHKAAEKMGCRTEITAVGDRYVLECMRRKGYSLGGEQSGHIIFLDYNTTGDGLLTAVQLMTVMKKQGRKVSELAGVMTRPFRAVKRSSARTAAFSCARPARNRLSALWPKGRIWSNWSALSTILPVSLSTKWA